LENKSERERERDKNFTSSLPPSHTHNPKKKPTFCESNLFEIHSDFGFYKKNK
jgi:hypothetical protein